MQTISDFKKRVTIGTKIYTELHWADKQGNLKLVKINEEREVSIVQGNSFALKTWQEKKQAYTDSWVDWPTKDEFSVIDMDTIQIDCKEGDIVSIRLIYKFL